MPSGSVIRYDGARGVVWRVKYRDAAGKQVMETVGREAEGFTRKQAESELRERLVRVERKGYKRPAPLTFTDWSETWFREGQTKRAWSSNTVVKYRKVVGYLQDHFGSRRLDAIRPRDVAGYIRDHHGTFAAKTLNVHVNVLHDVFKVAVAEEHIASNPVTGVERPKAARTRWRILEPHEVPRLCKAFSDDRARRVFLTFILTGLRRSELVGLRWGHVNLIDRTLRVVESKTEEGERLIALPHSLATELEQHYAATRYRADTDYVFAHPTKGSRLCADWFRLEFKAARKAAGIEGRIRLHDLRHAALTNLAATGASPIAVMATAGHRSMQTTKQYLHLAGVTFEQDAAALEARLLGGRNFYPTQMISDDLTGSEASVEA
jgi:site-specific recombinase XerD